MIEFCSFLPQCIEQVEAQKNRESWLKNANPRILILVDPKSEEGSSLLQPDLESILKCANCPLRKPAS